MNRSVLLLPLLVESVWAGILSDVRAALAQNDLARAERTFEEYRRSEPQLNAEALEALSWLGRGALAGRQLDKAGDYAEQTRRLVLERLKGGALDGQKHLPTALGASIEVQAGVLAARGQRSEAVGFLDRELKAYWNTSLRTRIQKNLHLLSLEGKPAPALETAESLGPKAVPLSRLRGRPVLLFFWAHWCPDCKAQAPVLEKLKAQYGPRGLVLVGPTQRYGYTRRGQEAPPAEETRYIDEIRRRVYTGLAGMPVPLSEENFKNYGASTVPTLVLIDGRGIVRLYHPDVMSYAELAPRVEAVLGR